MDWTQVVYAFMTHASKDSLGWVQLGVGMAIALVIFAVYRKTVSDYARERANFAKVKAQLQSMVATVTQRVADLQLTLQRNTEQELAMSRDREKRSEEHAELHASERNALIQAVSSLTESMTALKTLLEVTVLQAPKRRK